jgi:hypothetical protein
MSLLVLTIAFPYWSKYNHHTDTSTLYLLFQEQHLELRLGYLWSHGPKLLQTTPFPASLASLLYSSGWPCLPPMGVHKAACRSSLAPALSGSYVHLANDMAAIPSSQPYTTGGSQTTTSPGSLHSSSPPAAYQRWGSTLHIFTSNGQSYMRTTSTWCG